MMTGCSFELREAVAPFATILAICLIIHIMTLVEDEKNMNMEDRWSDAERGRPK